MVNDTAKSTVLIDGKQAEEELKKLTAESKNYRQEMEKAKAANDKAGFDKAEKQYKDNQKAIKSLKTELFSLDKVLNNLSGSSLNQLKTAQRAITAEMGKMTRGTGEYILKSKQLQQVEAEIRKVKTEMHGAAAAQQGWFSKASNGFNKYFGMMTAAAASFTGVVFGIRKSIDTFNQFEKGLSNLSALTGLEGDNLKWLGEEAKKLSITTQEGGVRITASATEILEAYKLMGSAKPELLGNKEALFEVTKQALILKEAADMETAPAIEALANIMNQFGAGSDQAAKYANVLAAGAKEGAAEIGDLADSIIRSGAAATSANIGIEQEVALIETLAEKGIKAEKAGTGLRGTILKLQKGSDEFNPKIVGMSKALENLAAKNLSAKEMIELFGEENYTVAQILVNNRQRFEELTDAVTGTNEVMIQAAKNTDNNAAKLEQAKNKANLMSIALGQKLAPAMTFSTNSFSYFMKVLLGIIWLFENYGKVILSVTIGISALTIALKAQAIYTWAVEKATKAAEVTMNLFNKASKANWLAVIIGLLASAASAFLLFRKDVKDATDAQNDFNKAVKEGNDILANNKPIEERYKILSTLNRRQVEQLKDDINSQIKAEEDYTSLLLSELQKRLDADKVLNDYKMDQAKSKNVFDKAWYQHQIDLRKKELAEELEAENKKHVKSKRMLEQYLIGVNSALKKLPFDSDPLLSSPGNFDDKLKATENEFRKLNLLITENYNKDKITSDEYHAQMLMNEWAYLNAKLVLHKKFGKDTLEVEQEIANKILKSNQEFESFVAELDKQNSDFKNKFSDDVRKENENIQKDIQDSTKSYVDGVIKEFDRLQNEYKQQADTARGFAEQFGSSFGDAIGTLMSDQEDAQKEFGKKMVLLALDTLDAVINIAIGKIWAEALSSPESVLTFGAAGIGKAALITGLLKAATGGLKALVTASMSQRYAGKYDVIGADDGRTYQASYGGATKTGIYSTPTLVAERGDELIVDHGTLNNLRLNFPHILPTIRAAMVPQKAAGNVGSIPATSATDPELKALIKQQSMVISALAKQLEEGLTADISFSRAKDKLDKGAAAQSRGSRTI